MLVHFPGAGSLQPKTLGKIGEDVACGILQRQGWSLIGRNERVGHDEMDALFIEPTANILVVVEVKTRTSEQFGSGIEAITPTKIGRLRRAIARWLAESETYYPETRIDCMELTLNRAGDMFVVTHFPEVG